MRPSRDAHIDAQLHRVWRPVPRNPNLTRGTGLQTDASRQPLFLKTSSSGPSLPARSIRLQLQQIGMPVAFEDREGLAHERLERQARVALRIDGSEIGAELRRADESALEGE